MEKIIVFGKGAYWNYKKDEIEKIFEVEVILDNSVTDTELCGKITVTNPVNVNKYPDLKIYVMTLNFFSVVEQLINEGVNPERIIIPTMIKPYFNENEYIV